MSKKNFSGIIWNRTSELPSYNAVFHPTVPPAACPDWKVHVWVTTRRHPTNVTMNIWRYTVQTVVNVSGRSLLGVWWVGCGPERVGTMLQFPVGTTNVSIVLDLWSVSGVVNTSSASLGTGWVLWPHSIVDVNNKWTFLPLFAHIPSWHILCLSYFICGARCKWRSWLRHCVTNRKVAGSIPDGTIGIFRWHNPSCRTMALGSTQPLEELINRDISWGKGGRCVGLTTLPPSCAYCLKICDPQTPGTLRACQGL
jgi:hypothetical protein